MRYLLAILIVTATVVAADQPPQQIAATLYVAPMLGFRVVEGRIKEGQILSCKSAKEKSEWADHRDLVIGLDCGEGIRLVLNDVIFDPGQKVNLKVSKVAK
jgi:hypothetical protein